MLRMRSTPHAGTQLTRSISSSAAPRIERQLPSRQIVGEVGAIAAVFVFLNQIAVRTGPSR